MSRCVCSMIVAGVLAGLACMVGCNDPVARAMTEHRREKTAMWLGEAVKAEQAGPPKIRAAFREIDRQWNVEKRETTKNMREMDAWFAREQKHWRDKQSSFQDRIAEELSGHPEKIRPTAIRMFF